MYFNYDSLNQQRLSEYLELKNIINEIPLENKIKTINKLANDTRLNLININDVNLVGNDPATENDYTSINLDKCDHILDNFYTDILNWILENNWCYYSSIKAKKLLTNNQNTEDNYKKLINNYQKILLSKKSKEFKNTLIHLENIEDTNETILDKVKTLTDNRVSIIFDHIKSAFNLKQIYISTASIFKNIFLFKVSITITITSLLLLFYIYFRWKKITFFNKIYVFEISFITVGFLTFIRYITNQDFSYFFHTILFLYVLSSFFLTSYFHKKSYPKNKLLIIILCFSILNFFLSQP